jgi:hypothetical protein
MLTGRVSFDTLTVVFTDPVTFTFTGSLSTAK